MTDKAEPNSISLPGTWWEAIDQNFDGRSKYIKGLVGPDLASKNLIEGESNEERLILSELKRAEISIVELGKKALREKGAIA